MSIFRVLCSQNILNLNKTGIFSNFKQEMFANSFQCKTAEKLNFFDFRQIELDTPKSSNRGMNCITFAGAIRVVNYTYSIYGLCSSFGRRGWWHGPIKILHLIFISANFEKPFTMSLYLNQKSVWSRPTLISSCNFSL